MPNSQFLQIVFFLLCIESVAFVFLPLVSRLFPWSLGYAFSLSRILGLLIFALSSWVVVSLHILPSNFFGILSVLIAFFLIGFFYNRSFLRYFYAEDKKNIYAFYLVFLFFLFIRFIHPEIYWGEKPMDFTFLNYFTKLTSLPPEEPWASGIQMHYYYGGFFLFSSILKLSFVSPDLGYNFIVSLLPALYFSSLCLVFRALSVGSLASVMFSLLVTFSSNPEILIGVLSGKEIDSHLFWASTRVYPSPSFTEYPFWTFLFADLHPHFMALPFVGLFLFFLLHGFNNGFSLKLKILISANISFLVITNAWDAISCCLLLAFGWLAYSYHKLNFSKFILESSVFGLFLILFCLPIFMAIKTENAGSLLWATQAEFNDLTNILRIFGFWIVLTLVLSLFSVKKKVYKNNLAVFLTATSIILALIATSQEHVKIVPPWDIVIVFTSMIFLQLFSRFSERDVWPQTMALGAFTALFFIVIEHVVLIDRMNSYFKFHFFLWTCLSIYSLNLLYMFAFGVNQRKVYLFFAPILMLPLFSSLTSLWINVVKGFHWNLSGVTHELNGFNYYKNYNFHDYEIIKWLRVNSDQDAVVVEAHGPSYQNFTRISANTGIPTLLGWDFHVSQRGVSQEEISKRKKSLEIIYQNSNFDLVCQTLKEYNVDYIVVGDEEKKQYNIPLDRFPNSIPCMKLKFSSGNSHILQYNS